MSEIKTTEISFNNNIRIGKRKLHVQTSFDQEMSKANSSIFDSGELLDKRHFPFELDVNNTDLEKEIKQFHKLVISDLELLFFVADKVQGSESATSAKKIGTLFLEKGFLNEAIEYLELAIRINPNLENSCFQLGKAWFEKNKYDKAIENFKIALDKTPDYPDLHLLTARTFWKLENYPKAIEHADKAIDLNPDYHQAFYYKGLILIDSKIKAPKHSDLKPPIERLKDAEKNLRKALSLSNEYDGQIMDTAFEKLELKDEADTGFKEFESAYQPKEKIKKSIIADSEFYLKFMFAGLDKDNKTLNHYIKTLEKSVTQYPDYADFRKSLGTAYLIKSWHDFVKSIEEYRKSIEINPDYEKAKNHLKLLENDSRGFLILLRAILK